MKYPRSLHYIFTGALGLFLFFVFVPRFNSLYAVTKYWVGTSGGSFSTNSNWSTTSGSACGANQNTTAPGSSDVATFNPDCTNNASIDSAISVAGIDINASYTGTITQASGTGNTITVGSGSFDISAGSFVGGNATIDINVDFTVSGGNFTSTSATLYIGRDFTVSSGTFTHNSGTINFDTGSFNRDYNIGTAILNNVVIDMRNYSIQLCESQTKYLLYLYH